MTEPTQRIVYLNGEYLPETEAKISIFDRGFLMADGVYEVTSALGGKLIDFPGHCARLGRSLSELEMATPCTDAELLAIHRELIARNDITDGMTSRFFLERVWRHQGRQKLELRRRQRRSMSLQISWLFPP